MDYSFFFLILFCVDWHHCLLLTPGVPSLPAVNILLCESLQLASTFFSHPVTYTVRLEGLPLLYLEPLLTYSHYLFIYLFFLYFCPTALEFLVTPFCSTKSPCAKTKWNLFFFISTCITAAS